jgi:protein TonB
MLSRARTLFTFIAIMASLGRPATAQDALADAKALYDKAAYEEALKLLDQIGGAASSSEVHQYRALCLIALGRNEVAEREIAIVVAANPFFTPDPREVAPRVISMFTETRRKLLPQVIKREFGEARTLFKDGDRQRANERFGQVLRLLDDSALSEDDDLADLKLVASGFLDLVRAQPPASTSQPGQSPHAPLGATPIASTETATTVKAADSAGPVVTPPVAITQVLPQWRPPDPSTARRTFLGAVRVMIDADGKVTNAEMERTVYPTYDRIVLEAARDWVYRPATRNGRPIGSETTVEIRLEPAIRN